MEETDGISLLRALQDRDSSAYKILLDKYGKGLLKYANFFLHNKEDAEDILYDTYVALLEQCDKIRSENSLIPWMKKTIRNKCFNLIKHKGFSSNTTDDKLEYFIAKFRGTYPDPAEIVHIKSCLARLDKTERAILHFRKCRFTLKEMHDLTSLSTSRIRTILKNAIKNFNNFYKI